MPFVASAMRSGRPREGAAPGLDKEIPTLPCLQAWTARETPNPGLILTGASQRNVSQCSRLDLVPAPA